MIAEQVFEPTHNFMLTLLKGLGQVYQEQEQYAFAELTFKQLLEIVEQRGDQHPLRVSLLYQQIGLMCILQGRTEEGRQYIERSTSLVRGDTFSRSPQKDSLSFLQEAMMDGSRKKEI
jgi:tetratricopeptide (TPR) repeat protein